MLSCCDQIFKTSQADLNTIKMPFILLKDYVIFKYYYGIVNGHEENTDIYTNGPFVSYVLRCASILSTS